MKLAIKLIISGFLILSTCIIFAGGDADALGFNLQVISTGNNNHHPQIHNGKVVWDNGSSIFYYQGSGSALNFGVSGPDTDPQIHNGIVVWNGNDATQWYDGTVHNIPGGNYIDYHPRIYNNLIVWEGLYTGTNNQRIVYCDLNIPAGPGSCNVTNEITSGPIDDFKPQVHGGLVTWQRDAGNNSEIYYFDGTEHQITNNAVADVDPKIHNGEIVWSGFDGSHFQIYTFDGSTTNISNNNYDNFQPQIHNGQVTWLADGGSSQYIYFYNGSSAIQVTGGGQFSSPQIHDGLVVFSGYDGNDSEIYVFNSNNNQVIQVTDNMAEDTDPQIDNGQIVFTSNGSIVLAGGIDAHFGTVRWKSGEPIQNAEIEAYYFKGTANDFDITPIPLISVATMSASDGTFLYPPELDAPLQSGEFDSSLRGIRARVVYDMDTGLQSGPAHLTVTNYPDWDPLYPFSESVINASEIIFPNPVVFQPGTAGIVNAYELLGEVDSDYKLQTFLMLDSGATDAELQSMMSSLISFSDLYEWRLLKRGDKPIPSFMYFAFPSGPLSFLKKDFVSWGYDNSLFQTPLSVNYSSNKFEDFIETRVRPEIQALSPGSYENIPINLLAHSLGGIISRNWITRYNDDVELSNYVTFDAPHGGVDLSNILKGFFWTQEQMNGTSPFQNTPAFFHGWNHNRKLYPDKDYAMLASPDNPLINPEVPPTAFGIGEIRLSLFPVANGYCQRFMGGYQLNIENAGHSIQNVGPSFVSAAQFLTYGERPYLNAHDCNESFNFEYCATFGEGMNEDHCPGVVPLQGPSPAPNGFIRKYMTASTATQTDVPLHFDSMETVTVSGILSHDDASIVVLDNLDVEIPKANEMISDFEGATLFSFELNVSPMTGKLRLSAGGSDSGASLRTDFSNNYSAVVSLANPDYNVGQSVPITVSLNDSGLNPVIGNGASVNVEVLEPDNTVAMVSMFDDGAHGDGAASDGVYGGSFNATQPGWHGVTGTLLVDLGGGINAERENSEDFVVNSSAASIVGVVSETAVDNNADTLFDAVEFNIDISTAVNGEFRLVAELLDGTTLLTNLEAVFTEITAPSMNNILTLRVPAEIFQNHGSGGPFTLANIRLYDNVQSFFIDSMSDYTTGAYTLSDFNEPPLPSATSTVPSVADNYGGETITLYGQNLDWVTAVYLGTQQSPNINVINDTALSVEVPEWDGVNYVVNIKLVTPWGEVIVPPIFQYARQTLNAGSFEVETGALAGGTLNDLHFSDDQSFDIIGRARTRLKTTYTAPSPMPHAIGLQYEASADSRYVVTSQLSLRNWQSGQWDVVDTYMAGSADEFRLLLDLDVPSYVRSSDGQIEVRVDHQVGPHLDVPGAPYSRTPLDITERFHSRYDLLQMIITP